MTAFLEQFSLAGKTAVVTGAGEKAFSAGGDLSWITEMVGNADKVATVMNEASDIVYNMMACDKPIITAINGTATTPLIIALHSNAFIGSIELKSSSTPSKVEMAIME